MEELDRLAALVQRERETLISMWQERVMALPSAQGLDKPRLIDHLPELIDQLFNAFQPAGKDVLMRGDGEGSPPAHGLQRFEVGFDIEEVVAEYEILRGCIHDLADMHGVRMQGRPFQVLNIVFGEAVALSVKTFASQQLLELQRRREEYLSFVAHDVRTPLQAISLATRVLEQTFPGDAPESSRRMAETLKRNVQRLEELVQRILKENATVLENGDAKPERRQFELWPLVEGIRREMEVTALSTNARLLNEVPEEIDIYADSGMIKRVFENLVSNALRYTPGGEVRMGARDAGEATECWVSDNGSGMDANALSNTFQPKGVGRGNGHGYGLSIVKSFVERHRGKVAVESTEHQGTTVRFTMPIKGAGHSSRSESTH